MLKRLEAMEGELGALTEALRTGAGRLTGELESLESEMKDLGASAATQQSEVGQRTSTSMRWPPTAAAEPGTAPVEEEEAVEPVEEEQVAEMEKFGVAGGEIEMLRAEEGVRSALMEEGAAAR